MSIYDKLAELNITLPPVATPAAAYVPFVQDQVNTYYRSSVI